MLSVEKILQDAADNLGAAIGQSIPSDDRIIMDRVRVAYTDIKNALIVLRHEPHIHQGGGDNPDQCGLCGHDIRHEIHTRTDWEKGDFRDVDNCPPATS